MGPTIEFTSSSSSVPNTCRPTSTATAKAKGEQALTGAAGQLSERDLYLIRQVDPSLPRLPSKRDPLYLSHGGHSYHPTPCLPRGGVPPLQVQRNGGQPLAPVPLGFSPDSNEEPPTG